MIALSAARPEEARPRVALLRKRRHRADLDEAEAQAEHRAGYRAVLVEAGRQSDGIGKAETEHVHMEARIGGLQGRAKPAASGSTDSEVVRALRIEEPQHLCGAVEDHGVSAESSASRRVQAAGGRRGRQRQRAAPRRDAGMSRRRARVPTGGALRARQRPPPEEAAPSVRQSAAPPFRGPGLPSRSDVAVGEVDRRPCEAAGLLRGVPKHFRADLVDDIGMAAQG
jgi:hypothetical protein